MSSVRRRLPRFAFIAFLAVFALALLPTVSHALTHWRIAGAAGGWAEVCTVQGPKRVAIDAAGQLMDTVVADEAALSAVHLQHCPLCVLHSDGPPPLPVAAVALPLLLAGNDPPAAFLHAPRTLHAWRSAQPRGPPAFS